MLAVIITKSENIMKNAASYLQNRLEKKLQDGQKILLLLSGGSAVEVYKYLTGWLEEQKKDFAQNLTLGLVDERYGKPGHPNSNEKQIKETGLYDAVEKKGGKVLKVLTGKDPRDEAGRYGELIHRYIERGDEFWAVFGVGADGHTAGILPQNSAREFKKFFPQDQWVVYYELPRDYPNPFKKRITLAPKALAKVNLAVVVAKSQGKKEALRKIFTKDEPPFKTPAVLLRQKNGVFFTDKKVA